MFSKLIMDWQWSGQCPSGCPLYDQHDKADISWSWNDQSFIRLMMLGQLLVMCHQPEEHDHSVTFLLTTSASGCRHYFHARALSMPYCIIMHPLTDIHVDALQRSLSTPTIQSGAQISISYNAETSPTLAPMSASVNCIKCTGLVFWGAFSGDGSSLD